MDDVLQSKLDRGFTFFDGDRNGRITESDFTVVTSKLGEAFKGATKEKTDNLYEAFITVWKTYILPLGTGTGSDCSVGPEEFTRAFKEGYANQPEAFLRDFGALTSAWMEIADTDRDGEVDPEEFYLMHEVTFGVTRAQSTAAFKALDTDRNGKLDNTEIQQAAKEYWTSEDPAAPGNLLYGPQ